jgi:hypothetical protein
MRSTVKLFLFAFVSISLATTTVMAQGSTSFLPEPIQNIFGLLGNEGAGTATFITGRVSTALFFTMGILVLFGVIYAIMAAFRYIRSQGDAGEIENATKSIKAIFYGVAAMMIGIVGIALVFVFFNAGRPNPDLFQTCLSAPNSVGCTVCKAEGIVGGNQCETCENNYKEFAINRGHDLTNECKEPISTNRPSTT